MALTKNDLKLIEGLLDRKLEEKLAPIEERLSRIEDTLYEVRDVAYFAIEVLTRHVEPKLKLVDAHTREISQLDRRTLRLENKIFGT